MNRKLKIALIVAYCLIVAIALWVWVFPWIDKTYINRPGIGG